MASFTLTKSLSKLGHAGTSFAGARAWNPRIFAAANPRSIKVPSSNPAEGSTTSTCKQGASETVNNSLNESTQDKAYTTAEHVANKTKDMANQMSASAQNITEKAKQTMQDAWDSTKSTANKAADTVLGKTQESADYIKENAEAAKKNMK
ncbi:hypothetical protein VNO77_21040 [Canavalia gladiata]|uniref:Uncharacterized protein n=1 Tax=Canavalia gladiata TaxID=3824 RepID=A0AAN9QR54_CANGL